MMKQEKKISILTDINKTNIENNYKFLIDG